MNRQRVFLAPRLCGALLLIAASACASSNENDDSQIFQPGTTGDASAPSTGSGLDASAGAGSDAAAPIPDGAVMRSDGSVVMDAAADAGASDAALVDTGVVGDGGKPADGGDGGSTGVGIGLEGTGLSVFPTTGQPLDTPNGAWKYHEFPDAFCRDGSKAGITVYRNTASKKVMFFFEGGGACFDLLSCSTNPSAVDATDKAGPSGGILNRTNAANPVKDWNFVYVPYCTGDVFGGTKADGSVEGGPQKFVGFLNTQTFLQRVVPTFSDATDVLVTGVSAGGFGASTSVVLIQRAFPNLKVKLINDSGPPMPSSVLATCLQKKWRETWGYDNSILKDCGAACPNKDDFTFDYGLYLAKTFNNRLSGLIESAQDGTISLFFGAGTDNCSQPFLLAPAIPGPDFQKGLLEYRDAVKPYTNFGSYFPMGTQHTWLMGDSFYSGAIGSTKLVDWVSDIINDKGTKNVGP